jgi:hypothetical protein
LAHWEKIVETIQLPKKITPHFSRQLPSHTSLLIILVQKMEEQYYLSIKNSNMFDVRLYSSTPIRDEINLNARYPWRKRAQ